MGSFIYDGLLVEVDDRTLAHVQLVIVQKLRRGESFLVSWRDALSVGSGRSSIWMHPTIPLRFKFFGSISPAINDAWMRDLMVAANSPRGLVIEDVTGEMSARAGSGHTAHRTKVLIHPSAEDRP